MPLADVDSDQALPDLGIGEGELCNVFSCTGDDPRFMLSITFAMAARDYQLPGGRLNCHQCSVGVSFVGSKNDVQVVIWTIGEFSWKALLV
jgi:hypothetical protein